MPTYVQGMMICPWSLQQNSSCATMGFENFEHVFLKMTILTLGGLAILPVEHSYLASLILHIIMNLVASNGKPSASDVTQFEFI